LIAYRITRAAFIDDLSGEGARLYGGRWNSAGVAVLYLAESRALAALEQLANLTPPVMPRDLALAEISFPDDTLTLDPKALPPGWNGPSFGSDTQQLGDAWAQARQSFVLKVPSNHIVEEYNYVVNPLHPLFAALKIVRKRSYAFDPRLAP
jgi:RES domain-containing protein